MELGIFIPIGNNGWIISTNSPQYMPSFELNRSVTLRAEAYGFDFALSMIKLHGFGGKTQFWDHNLKSFTLMAALASLTKRIGIYATAATLTLPPAIVARMAATIDDISGGRFGINLVTGWQKAEYSQMGLWPGEAHFHNRYEYLPNIRKFCASYGPPGIVTSRANSSRWTIACWPAAEGAAQAICAGQSDAGMDFSTRYADMNFCIAKGINTPGAVAPTIERLLAAARATAARSEPISSHLHRRSNRRGGDGGMAALCGRAPTRSARLCRGAIGDEQHAHSQCQADRGGDGAINLNFGTFIGSPATVAHMLDELAAVPGVKGIC